MSKLLIERGPSCAAEGPRQLLRLLRPRSVALVGGRACAEVIRQTRRLGFRGELWPVHPSSDAIEGLPAYRSVDELPGVPDAAFVAVNRHSSVEVIRALAARGAGGAVCYASGFAEAGAQGAALQAQLQRAAGDMPFFGPNCHGFINYFDGAALWPEQHGGLPQSRGVALVTQSGNIALNLTMQQRGLPVGYLVTLGNQAAIDLARTIEALLEDARVTAIGLHIEGIGDASAFLRAATLARRRGVPVVAVKTGRSELGAGLALSHTASLGGGDMVASAYLRRAGVVRVRSFPILLNALALLHVHGPLAGREIASMSSSGGEASLIADAAEDAGLCFRALSAAHVQRLRASLPELASATNPLDYHNFNWGDAAALGAIYSAVMATRPDLTLLVLDFPRRDRCSDASFEPTVTALIAAARQTGARAAVVSTLAETLPEQRALQLMQAGIAALSCIEDAMAAIAAAAEAGALLRAPLPQPGWTGRSIPRGGHCWSEWDAKRALARHGMRVPAGALATSVDEAVAAAVEIGFPVALKSIGSAITHKTEIGAVRLQLADVAATRTAAAQLLAISGTLLVEAMVDDAVAELLIGINHDRVFGWYLVIGAGGTLVNLLDDKQMLLLPATHAEIVAAIGSLKVGRLLGGYRNRPAGDVEAAAAAVLALQEFALQARDRLLEVEVNPLIVRNAGGGAVAVDALVRLSEDPSHG
jgi:acyl-CoA synthetase (NDP forming)